MTILSAIDLCVYNNAVRPLNCSFDIDTTFVTLFICNYFTQFVSTMPLEFLEGRKLPLHHRPQFRCKFA